MIAAAPDRESAATWPARRASISDVSSPLLHGGVRQQLLRERAEDAAQIADGVDQRERAFAQIEPGAIVERLGHAWAGATLRTKSAMGKFQAVMAATTPTGTLKR